MSNRADSNEVVLYSPDRRRVEVVEVSKETWRWSIRECAAGPERRTIRRPFAATIEKSPNLLGNVLRLASTADELRSRARRRSS